MQNVLFVRILSRGPLFSILLVTYVTATTAYSAVNKIDMSQVSECFNLIVRKTLDLGTAQS